MLGDLGRTPYDLNFTLLGIPVRVHPLFWIVSALLGASGVYGDPVLILLWVLAVFVSILLHELGHALVIRSYGWSPSISLHALGGLASYRPTHYHPQTQIAISIAGPAAGFFLAALLLAGLQALGNPVTLGADWKRLVYWEVFPESAWLQQRHVYAFVQFLLLVNIYWGILNLLPIWPLDGGHIARDLLQMANPQDGFRVSLMISIGVAAGLAIYSLVERHDQFMAIWFGYFAFNSFQMFQGFFGRGGWR